MKTITTIEITDEMVRETIKRAVQKWNESVGPDEPILTPSDVFSEDVRDILAAALPIIEKAFIDELGLVEEYEYHTRRHRYITSWGAD